MRECGGYRAACRCRRKGRKGPGVKGRLGVDRSPFSGFAFRWGWNRGPSWPAPPPPLGRASGARAAARIVLFRQAS